MGNQDGEEEEGQIVGRKSRWQRLGAVSVVLLVAACSANKHEPKLSDEFKQKLEGFADHGKAVEEGMARQLAPSGKQAPRHLRAFVTLEPGAPIWIQSGKSRALLVQQRIKRVSIADPELAGIIILGAQQLMINAKPLPKVEEGPGQRSIQLSRTGTILGKTLTAEPRYAETTLTIWAEDGSVDIHTLVVADFIYEQVMLEVTVAELNRTAMEEHGLDFRVVQDNLIAAGFLGGGVPPGGLTTVPPQTNQPLLPLTVGQDRPTYAFIFPDENVTAFVKALQQEGLATILAQPKLLAMSGQNAVFQVGGEIPIRVASGFAADIEFKPFGTLVNFVPRVSEEGDIILTVTPEVSEPDFSNTVEGIPTFRTRRASTSTRLRSGETLVIGGLLQQRTQEDVQGIPYLKDIPILGYAFRQTLYVKEITELMVIVKPSLVQAIPPGEDVVTPTARGPMTREEVRTKAEPAKTTRPRVPLAP